MTHGESGRALSELLALSADLPDDISHHLKAAQLFSDAGDNRHALEQFQRALRLAPANAEALAGAGLAAFQLGEYAEARQYLRRTSADAEDVRHTRELVDLVISNDPLAVRLGSAERQRRFLSDFEYASDRLNACLARSPGVDSTDQTLALQGEVQAFQDRLTPKAIVDQDTVEEGFDLLVRIELNVVARCGPATPRDQALILIGRQHGAGPQ
jgi:tetratricopeptide (TPR) repeat protein